MGLRRCFPFTSDTTTLFIFPGAPCSHGQRSLAMCLCVYTLSGTLLPLVEGRTFPSARFSPTRLGLERSVKPVTHEPCIIPPALVQQLPGARLDCRIHVRSVWKGGRGGERERRAAATDLLSLPPRASRLAFTEIHDRSTCGWAVKENSHG